MTQALTLVQKVSEVFDELDEAISRFQAASSWSCREGCGDCCNSPEVEVTVLEALPHALRLWDLGKAEIYASELSRHLGKPCVFYVPSSTDSSLGRCSIYATRPMLCRMFGFTAQIGKDALPRLAACRWQKLGAGALLEKIDHELKAGSLEIPLFGYWEQRLSELDPSQVLSERLPINEAFLKAIDYVYWRQQALLP
jgi:Fe-S-cluster containining protein